MISRCTKFKTIRGSGMNKRLLFLPIVLCAFSASANAGQYAEELGVCVYKNLTSSDKTVMTQWAFVTLGKTKAARQITVIPDAKTKEVNQKAKAALSRIMTQNCAKEATKVALHESQDGLKNAAATLALRLAQDELSDKMDASLSGLLNPGTANVLKGAEVLKGFFEKR